MSGAPKSATTVVISGFSVCGWLLRRRMHSKHPQRPTCGQDTEGPVDGQAGVSYPYTSVTRKSWLGKPLVDPSNKRATKTNFEEERSMSMLVLYVCPW
jgi:hypothetical protein